MDQSTVWWVMAGTLVVAELMTGTFYLLMVALGLVAGAIASHLGLAVSSQLVVAALVGTITALLWHFHKARHPSSPPASANSDVNMDVGQTLHVEAWNADGSATVKYRGAMWSVLAAPGVVQQAGLFKIREVSGSRFIVEAV